MPLFHGFHPAPLAFPAPHKAEGRTASRAETPSARRGESPRPLAGRNPAHPTTGSPDDRITLVLSVFSPLVGGIREAPSGGRTPAPTWIIAYQLPIVKNYFEPVAPGPRSLQEWEQGRRRPEGAVRAHLTVIDRNPEAAEKALTNKS
jgi:hypothetical protein